METAQIRIPCRFGTLFLLFLSESVSERGFRGIHPPSVHALIEKPRFEILPENIAGLRIVCIVNLVTGPGPLIEQGSDRVQGMIDSRFRAESGPYREHVMHVIFRMQPRYPFSRIGKISRLELKRVPMRLVTPILPVLYDVVERNPPVPILFHYGFQFVERLVSLTGLPETVDPFAEHRHMSSQFTISCHRPGHVTAMNEIVVRRITHLGSKAVHPVRILELGSGIIVPKQSVATGRYQHRIRYVHVRMHQTD